MRKFRLLNQQGYHGIYKGQIYKENFIAGDVSVLKLTEEYPKDWEEVFDEPKPLHKDTDLGYFSLEIMKSLISIAPYLKKDTSKTANSDFAANCIGLAEELIKQLDAKSK